jgi:adenylate cyclase
VTEPHYEHERRFLVDQPQILEGHEGYEIRQVYLWAKAGGALRIRQTSGRNEDGSKWVSEYLMTFKGPKTPEGTRIEEEDKYHSIPAAFIMAHEPNAIRKTRIGIVEDSGATFEVDVFHDRNEGLIIAEFEASEVDVALLKKPEWCGEEVTADKRYNNENLAQQPWTTWPENRKV